MTTQKQMRKEISEQCKALKLSMIEDKTTFINGVKAFRVVKIDGGRSWGGWGAMTMTDIYFNMCVL